MYEMISILPLLSCTLNTASQFEAGMLLKLRAWYTIIFWIIVGCWLIWCPTYSLISFRPSRSKFLPWTASFLELQASCNICEATIGQYWSSAMWCHYLMESETGPFALEGNLLFLISSKQRRVLIRPAFDTLLLTDLKSKYSHIP